MKVQLFQYCVREYCRQAGIKPERRAKLSPDQLARLMRYSYDFFKQAPDLAQSASKSGRPRLLVNGHEIAVATLLDIDRINISFIQDSVLKDQELKDRFLSVMAEVVAWSRNYLKGMPKDLRLSIFSQKLQAQKGYQQFMAQHPRYELIDIADVSSGRYVTLRSTYVLVFADKKTGQPKRYVLKPTITSNILSQKPVNEEFYSRYLALFGRQATEIKYHNGLSFIEYVAGLASRELFSAGEIKPEYQQHRSSLITWFAQEAALADMVSKGDRTIGLMGGGIWGNYIVVLAEKEIARIVSIDHEYVFNRSDKYTLESAEGQGTTSIELTLLTAFPEFADPQQRAQLFALFSREYQQMAQAIRQRAPDAEQLIREYPSFGEEEIAIFRQNLARDVAAWLNLLLAKTEIYWQRHRGEA